MASEPRWEAVSAIPGRVRFRLLDGFSRVRSGAAAANRLTRIRAVREVEIVWEASSLIVHFDAHLPLARMATELESTLSEDRVEAISAADEELYPASLIVEHASSGRMRLRLPQ